MNRSKLRLLVALMMGVLISPIFGEELKKEKGWKLVQADCGGCHSLQVVTTNRGNRTVWLNLIRWMQKEHNLWSIPPDQEDAILNYLSAHYITRLPMRRRPLGSDQLHKSPNP